MSERTATDGDTEFDPSKWPVEIVKKYAGSLSEAEREALAREIWEAMQRYGDLSAEAASGL